MDKSGLISLFSMMLFYGFIATVIIYPTIFKFGYIKAKLINMLIIIISTSLITMTNVGKNLSGVLLQTDYFTKKNNAVLFAAFAVIMLFISWILSHLAYSKKQF